MLTATIVRIPPKRWFALALGLSLAGQTPATADALWDFYFGPGAVRCEAIGTTPKMAVAVAHDLPIAAAKRDKMVRWFAAHQEYAAEIDRRRLYYEQHCRADEAPQ
jgi:hypothetical protein